MKKVWMMLAAFGAFALVAGESVEVNGKFVGSEVGAQAPKGWVYNTSTKPVGTGEVVKEGEAFGVKVVNPAKAPQLHYYYNKFFPVTAGETYEVSVEAVGKGAAGVGVYYSNAKGWVLGDYGKPFALKEGVNTLSYSFTVPEEARGKKPDLVRFAFYANGNSEVVFKNFTVVKK